MQHQHEDIHGRIIQIGDCIVFPKPGYGSGSGMAPLGLGEVVAITKGGVKVKYLDKHWNYEQTPKGHHENTNEQRTDWRGIPVTDYHGNPLYKTKFVVDYYEDKEPVLVKATSDRYFIVQMP